MENTLANKACFMAQYWGQMRLMQKDGLRVKKCIQAYWETTLGSRYLKLKPITSISKEDAIHICMLLSSWPDSMSKLTEVLVRGRIDGDHVWDVLVMKFVGSHEWCIRYRGNDWMGWRNTDGYSTVIFNHSEVNDYLRSKGYALPWMGLSVENQIEYGWVNLSE